MKQPINKIKYYPFGPRINAIDRFIKKENTIIGEKAKGNFSPQQFLSSVAREKQCNYGNRGLTDRLRNEKALSLVMKKYNLPKELIVR